jgi:chromosome segregation ATPase
VKSRLNVIQDELTEARAEVQSAQPKLDALAAGLGSLEAAVGTATAKLEAAEIAHRTAQVELLQARMAGARQAHAERSAEVAAVERTAAKAEADLAAVRTVGRQAREDKTTFDAKVAALTEEKGVVDARLTAIDARFRAIDGEVAKLTPVASELDDRVREQRRSAAASRAATVAAEQGRAEAERLGGLRQGLEQAHRELRAERIEAESVMKGWDDKIAALEADLQGQPEQIELVKEAPYTITRHRRTCTVRADAALSSPNAPATTDSFPFTSVDEDDTWRAKPSIRLDADPLSFGQPDDAALATLTNEAAGAIGEALRGQVRAEGRGRRGIAATELDAATRLMVLADFMDPDDSLTRFVDERYDLP